MMEPSNPIISVQGEIKVERVHGIPMYNLVRSIKILP